MELMELIKTFIQYWASWFFGLVVVTIVVPEIVAEMRDFFKKKGGRYE